MTTPQDSSDKARQIREKVQDEIVRLISSKLEEGTLNEARAKEIANLVLEKLPQDISYGKLMQILPQLDDHFEELGSVVVPIMIEYEQKVRKAVNDKITQLIKEGKLDEALNVARKALEFEKGLA
jgi:hypothetical protein